MADGIVYLDIDDEITSAAARVRSAGSKRVVLVLPYGSRVATSRINFRLLSRDALISEKHLSVVAGDSATRALAASAGLPVFASVGEYEASLAGVQSAAGAPSEPSEPVMSEAPVVPPATAAAEIVVEPRVEMRAPSVPPREFVPHSRSDALRGSRLPLVIGLAVLGLALLVGGVGAYVVLPSATIVVAPRPENLVPLELTVTADPTVSQPNATSLVVPAEVVSVDVVARGTFPATGKRVEETVARGAIRFSNLDFLRTNTVASGSIVSTAAGVRFRTVASVTVPMADLVGLTVFPGRITVNVTAVEPGRAGNVEPNTIVIVPRGEDPQALKVVNPEATTRGTREEFAQVAQKDVDAALAQLTTELSAEFEARLIDPSIAPTGATVFRETAALGEPAPSVDPATLVGQEMDSFELELAASGTVVAVDPAPVATLADERLRATVEPGYQLVAGSIDVQVGEGIVAGQSVTFLAAATARQIAVLDPDLLLALVLGKSLDDARQILAPYGEVELTAWPDWVSTIPTFTGRVELRVDGRVPVETWQPPGSTP